MIYDSSRPVLSVVSPEGPGGVQREMQIGQDCCWGEADFFAKVLGYRVNISVWNGLDFQLEQYFLPDDYM